MTFQSALLAGLLAVTDGTWEVVPDDGAKVVSLDPLARERAAGGSYEQAAPGPVLSDDATSGAGWPD